MRKLALQGTVYQNGIGAALLLTYKLVVVYISPLQREIIMTLPYPVFMSPPPGQGSRPIGPESAVQ